ncbi:MAG: DUF1998 domain-containing protein [Nitrososphaerales archaeon]
MTYSLEEPEDRIHRTAFEAIYSGFDNVTFHHRNKSVKVLRLNGPPISNDDAVLLRPVVSSILQQTRKEVLTEVAQSLESKPLPKEIDELSEALGLDSKYEKPQPFLQPMDDEADDGQTLIILPQEGSVDVYPRTWFCKNCGYYRLASPASLKTLDCPLCKETYAMCHNPKCAKKNKVVAKRDTCATCGFGLGAVGLLQLSVMFVCPQCARQEEICPPFVRPENARAMFECEECGKPMKLILRGPMTKWHWECGSNPGHKCLRGSNRVNQFCPECSTWGKNGQPRRPVSMRLRAASSNYLKPQVISLMRVGSTLDINEDLLSESAGWKLSEQNDSEWQQKLEFLKRRAIDDLWIVNNVRSYTVNYGYTFNSFEPGLKVNLYSSIDYRTKRPAFKAYAVVATGKGLYVKFNKARIASAIGIQTKDYDSTASNSILNVKNLSSRDLKERGDALISVLHAAEHALLSQASLVTGLADSSFAGKIMLRDCGVLIAERENVETSGIDYIVQRKINEWLLTAELRVSDCRYNCQTACVKCLFVRDPLCHPLIPGEGGDRFFTPNNLLSRKSLLALWNGDSNA